MKGSFIKTCSGSVDSVLQCIDENILVAWGHSVLAIYKKLYCANPMESWARTTEGTCPPLLFRYVFPHMKENYHENN